jgi:hypothetical protein
MLWIVSGTLFVVWLVCVLLNKGGAIHMILLTAIAIAVVEAVATGVARSRRNLPNP